jgi:hypothetical protein
MTLRLPLELMEAITKRRVKGDLARIILLPHQHANDDCPCADGTWPVIMYVVRSIQLQRCDL